jgi:hypothetical protein
MQLVYRRKLDAIGVVMVVAANICILSYRLWFPVWLAYLWLRHRHDGTKDDWLTKEDLYCERYYTDPDISPILDELIDYVGEGLALVCAGEWSDEDDLPAVYYETCARVERAIAERIWQEDPKLDRRWLADRRWVYEEARARAMELVGRMFEFPPALDFDDPPYRG